MALFDYAGHSERISDTVHDITNGDFGDEALSRSKYVRICCSVESGSCRDLAKAFASLSSVQSVHLTNINILTMNTTAANGPVQATTATTDLGPTITILTSQGHNSTSIPPLLPSIQM